MRGVLYGLGAFNGAGDGRGGQPWRRSRPVSSEVHEVGDVEAVTHVLWISTY